MELLLIVAASSSGLVDLLPRNQWWRFVIVGDSTAGQTAGARASTPCPGVWGQSVVGDLDFERLVQRPGGRPKRGRADTVGFSEWFRFDPERK